MIGHTKVDGLLGRNFLLGTAGDAINAVLAGAGHNLRLLRRWLAELLVLVVSWLVAILAPPGRASATRTAF